MAILYVDFSRLEVYEAGALLLAHLAYPGENRHDNERRSQVHTSLCACTLRALYEAAPEWGSSPQLIKPIYALQTERDCNQSLRQFKRRLRDRMIAARMAYPFLKAAASGEAPELLPSVQRLSVNAMSELVLEDAGYNEPENVETRIGARAGRSSIWHRQCTATCIWTQQLRRVASVHYSLAAR